ncbi:MAG TPA: ATP-binding cassette domain-containing protein [Thermoanaerobaculia bacterium]|nr:ATP-binding cassette domain-containing protein [Thermoanaerobaculia bacterium]
MSSDTPEDALLLDRLTVRYRRIVACDAVSLRVRPGSVHALLGRTGAGKSSLLRCVLGELKPTEGRVLVFGHDARRERRKLRSCVRRMGSGSRGRSVRLKQWLRRLTPGRSLSSPSPTPLSGELLARAFGGKTRLLVLDDVTLPTQEHELRAVRETLRHALEQGRAVLIATKAAGDVEHIADRVAILDRGRLLLDDDTTRIKSRFRRIRYGNEITPTRTEFGHELDLFDAVRVRARGWGVEAIVSNYSEESFERFRQIDGVVEAEATKMTLAEVFDAVSPEASARQPPR